MAQAGGATLARESQAVHAAALRADKTAARREREDVFVSANNNDAFEADAQAQLTRNRFADRKNNGVGFSEILQDYGGNTDLAEELGEETSEEEFEHAMFAMQQESSLQDRQQDMSRIRSIMHRMKDDRESEMMEKAMKEMKDFLQKRQADLVSKGSSLIDEGEFVEVLDAVGVSLSTAQMLLFIFKDSIPPEMMKKLPVKPYNLAKFTDVAMVATYAPQVLWFSLKVIIVLLAPFILPLIAAGACYSSTMCSGAADLLSSFF